ncbi:hypothetical protein HOY82DRAFT_538219 [Tuber indicum]|nr:hypothetical protein HOY82DRAFT_538219 [Tuber indicum]
MNITKKQKQRTEDLLIPELRAASIASDNIRQWEKEFLKAELLRSPLVSMDRDGKVAPAPTVATIRSLRACKLAPGIEHGGWSYPIRMCYCGGGGEGKESGGQETGWAVGA